MRRLLWLCLALLVWTCSAVAVNACPFCSMQGQTLTNEIDQASMVLYGTLQNAHTNRAGGGLDEGSTDLALDTVVKGQDIVAGRKVVTLTRFVPLDPDKTTHYLVFCDVYKNKVDPYRGFRVKAGSDVARYLQGAMKVKDKDVATRLRYFFNYLDNPDPEVADDAYKEFGNADYKDYREMAAALPPDKLAGWLTDANTQVYRRGLYASMLGHCGKDEHARVLRSLLDESQDHSTTGLDGMLAGYTMLKPKEGWDYVQTILRDPSKEFTVRYAALRAVRFFWTSRPDLIDRKQLVAGVCLLLDQPDIADLAIEDLRKWSQWLVAERVLELGDRPSHNTTIIRRSLLRYALSCPEQPQAAAFLTEARKKDPRAVQLAEDALKFENAVPEPKK